MTDQPLKLIAVMDDSMQAEVMAKRTYPIPPNSKGTPITASGVRRFFFITAGFFSPPQNILSGLKIFLLIGF
jgi:hypothetical protein